MSERECPIPRNICRKFLLTSHLRNGNWFFTWWTYMTSISKVQHYTPHSFQTFCLLACTYIIMNLTCQIISDWFWLPAGNCKRWNVFSVLNHTDTKQQLHTMSDSHVTLLLWNLVFLPELLDKRDHLNDVYKIYNNCATDLLYLVTIVWLLLRLLVCWHWRRCRHHITVLRGRHLLQSQQRTNFICTYIRKSDNWKITAYYLKISINEFSINNNILIFFRWRHLNSMLCKKLLDTCAIVNNKKIQTNASSMVKYTKPLLVCYWQK